MWPWRCPVYRWRELVAGAGTEQENLSSRVVTSTLMLAPGLLKGEPRLWGEYRSEAQGRTGS